MAVTKDEWSNLSWKTRIEIVTDTLHISKADLAKKLGVSRKTIYCWESGKNKPTGKHAKMLISLGVQTTFSDIKEESYMAMHSLSTDASSRLLQNASQSNDPVMLAMATHCIAVKQAALLHSMDPQRLIVRIVSLYGKSTKTTLQVQSTCYPVEKRAAEISILRTGEDGVFVINTRLSGSSESKFAFTVSDRAMVVTAKRILNFLT